MKKITSFLFITLLLFLLNACKGNSSATTSGTGSGSSSSVSCADIESRITTFLNSTTTADNLPFTYLVERLSDGKQFSYSKSGSTPTTSYESASTSKWVSGIIILRAIENGNLASTDKPQTYLGS
ncbi:MAG: hypothetical protein Q7U04_07240, partial [Bacteriovorax sp.]|nr:hypothetical protein [Bacteriovorax sp.]